MKKKNKYRTTFNTKICIGRSSTGEEEPVGDIC